MGKWDKLNSELDGVLAKLTDADWEKWLSNQEKNEIERREAEKASLFRDGAGGYFTEPRRAVFKYKQELFIETNETSDSPGSCFFNLTRTMEEPQKTAFSFVDFQIKTFSFNEPDNTGDTLDIQLAPRGKYYPNDGIFKIFIDFAAFENSENKRQIIGCGYQTSFRFAGAISFEEIPNYFYKNAIAISYPYLRAFISTLTLQANVKLMVLPLMNLSHLESELRANTELINP
jgi:preprotein translocase subunit SecB